MYSALSIVCDLVWFYDFVACFLNLSPISHKKKVFMTSVFYFGCTFHESMNFWIHAFLFCSFYFIFAALSAVKPVGVCLQWVFDALTLKIAFRFLLFSSVNQGKFITRAVSVPPQNILITKRLNRKEVRFACIFR